MRALIGVSQCWRAFCIGAAMLVTVVTAARPAVARQYDVVVRAERTARRPALSQRDIKDMTELLRLSESQKAAAQELVQAYQASCRDLSEQCDELELKLGQDGEQSDWNDGEDEAYGELMHARVAAHLELHRGVMTDLRALLTKEQEPSWERFERAQRRRSTLPWGEGSPAAGTDLIELVKTFDAVLPSQPAVADVLASYETELDRELVARNSKVEKLMLMKDESVAEQGVPNPDDSDKLFEELRAATRRMSALNRRVAESLIPLLSDEKQAKFREEIQQEFYPTVYGKRHIHRVLDAIASMKDVEAAQLEAIKGVRERYEREAQTCNTRWVQALIRASTEKDETQSEAESASYECRQARNELDAKTIEDIKKILTEGQRKGLPSIGFRREIQQLKPPAGK